MGSKFIGKPAMGPGVVIVDGSYHGQIAQVLAEEDGYVYLRFPDDSVDSEPFCFPATHVAPITNAPPLGAGPRLSRANAILAVLRDEINARWADLDAPVPLTNLSVIVYLDRDTGRPHQVSCRTETIRPVRHRPLRRK